MVTFNLNDEPKKKKKRWPVRCANILALHRFLEQFFPELERVVLLDDDVVIRKDLAGLWELDLDGNIIGAVGTRRTDADAGVCLDKTFGDHLNFSDLELPSLGLRRSQCAWSWGVNVVDLDAWRRTNVKETYQFWLQKASLIPLS
jgi:galacturonosyltransferase 12/13/14/15